MRNQASPGAKASRTSFRSRRRAIGVAVVLHAAAAGRRGRGARRARRRAHGDAEAVRAAHERRRARGRSARAGPCPRAAGAASRPSRRGRRCSGARCCPRSRRTSRRCAAMPKRSWNARPDVGPETGAGGDPQPVVAVARRRRLAQEVAAELADVDERDRLVAAHVVEERARAEAPPRREGAAGAERGREADEQALAVVERQRRVDGLVRARCPSSWRELMPPIVKRRWRTIAGFG